jgi:hypothetical protein
MRERLSGQQDWAGQRAGWMGVSEHQRGLARNPCAGPVRDLNGEKPLVPAPVNPFSR